VPKTRLFIYSLQRAAFTKIAPGRGKPHLRISHFVIFENLSFRAFFFRSTFASPLKIKQIEPALRTEVQHAQIHRLVSFGHRLLYEKIPSAKKPCRPIIEHASLFSHFCFRCERRCGRSSPPLCFSYPRRPSLLVPVNTRARTYCDLLTFFFFAPSATGSTNPVPTPRAKVPEQDMEGTCVFRVAFSCQKRNTI